MIEIITAFKTSHGIFLDKTDATKKKNREFDGRDHIYEPVQEVYLIKHTKANGVVNYFSANPVETK